MADGQHGNAFREMKTVYPPFIKGKVFEHAMNRVFGEGLLYRYLRHFFQDLPVGKSEGERILLFSVIGSVYDSYIEMLLYHLLRARGFWVDFVVCDGGLASCEILTQSALAQKSKEKRCRECFGRASRQLKAANISFEILDPTFFKDHAAIDRLTFEEILSFSYEGIFFGELVRSAACRYYKSSAITSCEGALDVMRRLLLASLQSYSFAKVKIECHDYRAVFFSHGIYTSWGGIEAYCQKKGVRYVCYDRSKTLGTANFNINQPSPNWSFNAAWEHVQDLPLQPSLERKVVQLIRDRERQLGDVFQYNSVDRTKNLQAVKRRIGISPGKKVVTLFTNLIWDASSVSRDIAFSSGLEWLKKTCLFFSDRSDVIVLIRTHPAEQVLGTSETFSGLLRQTFSDGLPDNVVILDTALPEVNSFDVIDMTDIGVAHTSTVGIELALFEKPVILVSETHFRGKGFTYDVNDETTYFDTISSLLDLPVLKPRQKVLAMKYFGMMMFDYQKETGIKMKRGWFNGYGARRFRDWVSLKPDLARIVDCFDEPDRLDFVDLGLREG